MTDIEEKLWADMLFEKSYERKCYEVGNWIPIVSKEHVLSLFFADASSLSPIETMRKAIDKSEAEYIITERELIKEELSRKSCTNCGLGDGEGGCTIPGYCNDMSEFRL